MEFPSFFFKLIFRMSNKISLLFLSLFFCFSDAKAQLEKTIHQTFFIDDASSISVDLIGDSISIVPWAGNTILTETKVELYDASPSILAHFLEKEQRYAIEADTTTSTLKLFSVNQERKPIRTRTGECPEIVQIRVFYPDNFAKEGDTKLVKKEEP